MKLRNEGRRIPRVLAKNVLGGKAVKLIKAVEFTAALTGAACAETSNHPKFCDLRMRHMPCILGCNGASKRRGRR